MDGWRAIPRGPNYLASPRNRSVWMELTYHSTWRMALLYRLSSWTKKPIGSLRPIIWNRVPLRPHNPSCVLKVECIIRFISIGLSMTWKITMLLGIRLRFYTLTGHPVTVGSVWQKVFSPKKARRNLHKDFWFRRWMNLPNPDSASPASISSLLFLLGLIRIESSFSNEKNHRGSFQKVSTIIAKTLHKTGSKSVWKAADGVLNNMSSLWFESVNPWLACRPPKTHCRSVQWAISPSSSETSLENEFQMRASPA